MLVVQWWRSFACPSSQAEGKRYHDWDGCIERITQLDSWPDVRTGSSTEMLRVSISRLLFPKKADARRLGQRTVDPGCPSHAARIALASGSSLLIPLRAEGCHRLFEGGRYPAARAGRRSPQ